MGEGAIASDRIDAIDWSVLEGRLQGAIVRAGDERMVLAGKHFAAGKPLAFPRALIRCRGLDDVREALDFLRSRKVPFAVRSGGHCFGDLSSGPDAMIDLAEMNQVAIGRDRVWTQPGACAADVSRVLAAQGLSITTGGCPWVGFGGLSLVGGFGFLGRRHGLVTDRVERLQVVTAAGEVIESSAREHSDLFWALCGAGAGGFGIVTGIELRTLPLDGLTVCYGVWTVDAAVELMAAWQHWAPDADGDVNIELGLIGPDFLDEPCRIELFGVVLSDAGAHLAKLRRLLGPRAADLRTWVIPPTTAADYLMGLLNRTASPAWQPSRPYRDIGYQFTRSDFFETSLSVDAIRNCVELFQSDRRYAQFRELELIPWGGAYAQRNPTASFQHRTPRLMIRHTAMTGTRSTPELRAHARQWVDASRSTLSRYANGHVYQGYADLQLRDWAQAYYGTAYPRLRQIKRRYDPDNLFRHGQSIEPA